jgi:5'-nucleotidase
MAEPLQILLSNDDGIESPGLWAAAEALSSLGYVHVVAPRLQSSGMGRSVPSTSDGRITPGKLTVHGKEWTVYAVNGSPAQAVMHGVLEISPRLPDLVVSGINYGENLGTGVTASGTVGAALEAAAFGIPAIAISLQMDSQYFMSYSREIDFTPSKHFLEIFARALLARQMPADVDLLKIDIPAAATAQTDWKITRQSRHRYYRALQPKRKSWEDAAPIDWDKEMDPSSQPEDSDIFTLLVKQQVSVTPLSIDLTSRTAQTELDGLIRSIS